MSFAENAFRRLLKERGLRLETMTIDEGIDAMREFHADHRAQHTIGGEDALRQRRRGDTVTISRSMTRSDDHLTRTLTLAIDSHGGRLTFS